MNPVSSLGEKALVTVINCGKVKSLDEFWLRIYIEDCLGNDDVFRKEFLEQILITSCTQRKKLMFPTETQRLVGSWGTKSVEYKPFIQNIPPGPYVGVGKRLWPASRLYDDVQGAFFVAIKPCNRKG